MSNESRHPGLGNMRPPFQFRVTLHYTDPDRLVVLHRIPVDLQDVLYVIGDPDNGSYEWALDVHGADGIEHSDCGYGSPDIALRDALIIYHGAPDDLPKKVVSKRRPSR